MTERLLSVHDLSNITGWSPLTIYKKTAAGEIPGRVRIGKRTVRFKQSDVLAWLFGEVTEKPISSLVSPLAERLIGGQTIEQENEVGEHDNG